MKFLTQSDYKVMPWKNGGGTTTELAIHPEDSGVSSGSFQWRVSIAEVASSGPFSRFEGYDRHIMLIAGDGMVIDAGSNGRIVLEQPYRPAFFSGDWTVTGTLKGGPVRDFNLIAARNTEKPSKLEVLRIEKRERFSAIEREHLLLHLLEGELLVNGRIVAETESLILIPFESVDAAPLGREAVVAIARMAGKED